MKVLTTVLGLLWVPIAAFGHHSVQALYEDTIVEIEGEVTDVLWRNPHVGFTMNVLDDNGQIQEWDMAMTALSNLRRWQIPRDFLVIGETIRVAGHPSRQGGRAMYISNALRPSGEEILLLADAVPRWSDRTVEMSESRRSGLGDPSEPERGIFRVWSRPPSVSNPFFQMDELERYLTDSAGAAVEEYVQRTDIPIRDCTPKGMPTIMEAPYPWQFIESGDDLILHQEEYDTRRTIHMTPGASPDDEFQSRLGFSVGRWEDDTLIVTTTNSSWPNFNTRGIPLSANAVSVERFTMLPDGSRMDWEITVTDSSIFVEPVTLEQHWVWYPDAVVDSYDCLIAAEDQ